MSGLSRKKRGRPRRAPAEDEWHGILDPKQRKRVQDRIAQRARRQRLAIGSSGGPVAGNSAQAEDFHSLENDVPIEQVQTTLTEYRSLELLDFLAVAETTIKVVIAPNASLTKRWMPSNFWEKAQIHIQPSNFPWHAIYIALIKHALLLGNFTSPCQVVAPSTSRMGLVLPEPLVPTPLQLAVPHYNWIDRLPFPRVRDNMILLSAVLDYDEFLRDLFSMASIVMVKELPTWEPAAWTMGPEFATKWGYLFQ